MYRHVSAAQHRKDFGLPKDYKVDACIVYGGWDKKRYRNKFLQQARKLGTVSVEKNDYSFLFDILSVRVDKKRIWFIVAYGGTMLSEYLHLASLLGSKKNILIGTCGGLQKGKDTFLTITPTAAYSTESSSHMYLRNAKNNLFASDKNLSTKLIAQLEKEEIVVASGKTITCQAMLAETWNDVIAWSKKGYLGVEMEAATIFAVSKHFKVPSAALLQVADNLIEKETVMDTSYFKKRKKLNTIRNKLFDIVIRDCVKMRNEKS